MNKEDFLKELEKKLEILSVEERKKIMQDYKTKINKAVKKATEEEVIENLGEPTIIAKEILKERGINGDYVFTSDKNPRGYLKSFLAAVDNFVAQMSKKDFKQILKLIFEVVLMFFLVALVKAPFIFLRDLIEAFMNSIQVPITNFLMNVLTLGIEIIYLIVAITLFISIFKRRYGKVK